MYVKDFVGRRKRKTETSGREDKLYPPLPARLSFPSENKIQETTIGRSEQPLPARQKQGKKSHFKNLNKAGAALGMNLLIPVVLYKSFRQGSVGFIMRRRQKSGR